MKRLGILLGVALMAAQAGTASARSLEDVLKEKGVITEEDYKEIQKSSPIKYKLGEGFNLTSADGKFSTSIGGVYQLRYTLMDNDDVNNTAAKQAQDSSKFELRRIKLVFNGYAYSPDLTYKMTINFANIAGGATSNGGLLEETFVNYRLLDEVQFRFGQDKVQFGRQWITSSAAQQFVDASAVTNAFVPGYDTGVMIHGKIAGGLVNYNIAGYGGVGQNTYRSTTDNAFAARLTVNPLGDVKYAESDVEYSKKPLVSVGADFYRNTLSATEANTTNTATGNNLSFAKSTSWYGLGKGLLPAARAFSAGEALDFNMAGVDAAFKWRGFSATGEYFFAEADGQTTSHKLRGQGFYAQAGYFVIPKKVELAYRYSYIDPNRDAVNDLWVENAGAVSWYVNNQNLKVQADYTNVHKQAAIASTSGKNATDDQQVRFQVQMLF
ncbi:porin [Oryzomonas japonica]|uniref:Porin n=1 Tax=Oryzomonas japonica TaxID=2603858 RepID=A0A7J4ZRF6_9BACT|nr:porin [Oryzomonas japonica]KAB0665790.1 porin [Oryzomonas japonica]